MRSVTTQITNLYIIPIYIEFMSFSPLCCCYMILLLFDSFHRDRFCVSLLQCLKLLFILTNWNRNCYFTLLNWNQIQFFVRYFAIVIGFVRSGTIILFHNQILLYSISYTTTSFTCKISHN